MKWLTNMLQNNESKTAVVPRTSYVSEYKGLSDFLRNAPPKEKIQVFTEAARRASEDQRQTLKRAGVSF